MISQAVYRGCRYSVPQGGEPVKRGTANNGKRGACQTSDKVGTEARYEGFAMAARLEKCELKLLKSMRIVVSHFLAA